MTLNDVSMTFLQTDTEGSRQLYALMQNIRAIQDHFSPIIIGGLNETEILLIIQSNYDDLKLRILGMRFQMIIKQRY